MMVDLMAAFDGCGITDLVCLSSGFLLRKHLAVVVAGYYSLVISFSFFI